MSNTAPSALERFFMMVLQTVTGTEMPLRPTVQVIGANLVDDPANNRTIMTIVARGTGSPNGSVVGSPGDLYVNTSGGSGTTLYVKESGVSTNTGWVGK